MTSKDHSSPLASVYFSSSSFGMLDSGACAPKRQARSQPPSATARVCFLHDVYFRLFTFDFRSSTVDFLLSTFYFLLSKLAHKYQYATDRYGRHGSAIACNCLTSGVFRRL